MKGLRPQSQHVHEARFVKRRVGVPAADHAGNATAEAAATGRQRAALDVYRRSTSPVRRCKPSALISRLLCQSVGAAPMRCFSCSNEQIGLLVRTTWPGRQHALANCDLHPGFGKDGHDCHARQYQMSPAAGMTDFVCHRRRRSQSPRHDSLVRDAARSHPVWRAPALWRPSVARKVLTGRRQQARRSCARSAAATW